MQNYFQYFSEIEELFSRRRGSALLLSTLDWALIESWREAGVPLEAVLRGMDAAFDRYESRSLRAKGRLRKVNGLAWCAQAVMEAAEEMVEASTGTAPQHAKPTTQSGFETERIASYLLRNAELIAAASERTEHSAIAEPLHSLAQRLRELAASLQDDEPTPLEDLDRTLTVLEEQVVDRLRIALPEAELTALHEQADRELAPFRSRMSTVQLRQVQRQFLTKRLLESHALPRLSLFYMGVGQLTERLRIARLIYGGYGLAQPEDGRAAALVPFTLPGELIEIARTGSPSEPQLLRILEPSPARVEPGCPHFGLCGGCHLQMANYDEQLRLKRDVLLDALRRARVKDVPAPVTHASEPWGYRNRIRLHVVRDADPLHLGYRERKSSAILPITTCPIAAPLLWSTAQSLLALAARNAEMNRWLCAADEVELFCDDSMSRLQLSLLCTQPASPFPRDSFDRAMTALHTAQPALAGAGALRVHPRTGQIQENIAAWGSDGLHYEVAGERYWIARGSFFQVNRFLLTTLVDLVCATRTGPLAWDLFAGVGLFARILAHRFNRVTAVEANPTAVAALRAGLRSTLQQRSPQHAAVHATTLDFLRRAVLDRDRPDLVVLDPPRAGAGRETCDLLTRIAPAEIVYVSCDPVTLARDLAILESGGYTIDQLHLVDLFPQTYHQEAVVSLRRSS